MTERELQNTIIEAAKLAGYLCYHTHDSRRSQPGFPDLILIRDGELYALELKTEKGKVSDAQLDWLSAFQLVTTSTGLVVRPDDLDNILWLLTRRRTGRQAA